MTMLYLLSCHLNSAQLGFLLSISWKLSLHTDYPDMVWIKIMDSYNNGNYV